MFSEIDMLLVLILKLWWFWIFSKIWLRMKLLITVIVVTIVVITVIVVTVVKVTVIVVTVVVISKMTGKWILISIIILWCR